MKSESVANYAENAARLVPGLNDLHKMAGLLLAERTPSNAKVLVLGAGGGLELKTLAETQSGWQFEGVDPSAEMLQLAKTNLGQLTERVQFCEGYIEDASEGPFDAATCILTMHFLSEEKRRETLAQIHRRLKPGAPFVVAHHSFPRGESDDEKWLSRYAAFAISNGVPAEQARNASISIAERLPIISPDQDEALLREAGFTDVELFFAAFTFRGWVCHVKQSSDLS